ncbi:hypothetical protein DXG01_012500 [Tephrocybe rancida]|nr:hypothetical protein DXG01_012500 [Tephrocybe rancida]
MLGLQANPQMPLSNLASQGQFYHYQCAPEAAYSFTNEDPTACSLIPAQNLSPADFETSVHYYSPASSTSDSLPPSPLYEAPISLPSPSPKKPVTRLRSGNRVPRPRNAFMIFRSEFWAEAKISKTVEHDHRHISRIIGHCWDQLTEEEKAVWRRRAEQEKIEHGIKYPGYRFTPNVRTKQVIKRNVKRNGEDEMLRCKQVAELLLAGKAGKDLDNAVKSIDKSSGRESPSSEAKKALGTAHNETDAPVFRSPLLPPIQPKDLLQYHQYTPDILTPQTFQARSSTSYEQSWSLQYPTMLNATQQQTSYPVQHYTLEPQSVAASSSSLGYPTSTYYTTPESHHRQTLDPSHMYPRSSALRIEFVDPFEYHGRTESSPSQNHDARTFLDPNGWTPSHHGH